MAGSLKITALISFVAIGGIFFFEWTGWIKFEKERIFKNPGIFILLSILSMGLVFSWVFYASHYNTIHESNYFSTTVFPIWKLDSEGIKNIFKGVKENWFSEYFHFSIYILMALSLAYFIVFMKKFKIISRVFIIVLFGVGIAYILLQYSLLKDHDYYMTNIFIFPVILISITLLNLQNRHPEILNSILFKIAFGILLITNIFYTKNHLDFRYNNQGNIEKLNSPYYSITPYLREIGISRNDKVICLPGGSHINLVLMDQKGWTQWTDHKLYRAKAYQYNTDEEGINKCIQNGAKYLIINSVEDLYHSPFLHRFTNNLVGKYRDVLIFNLEDRDIKNFNINERKVEDIFYCNAETISTDMTSFYSPDSSKLFQNASTQSSDYAHSGVFSVCLNSNNPYGMTFSIDSVKFRESLQLSSWILGPSKNACIIVSAENPGKFYKSLPAGTTQNIEEWRKLEFELFIPEEMHMQSIKIYLYNPSEQNIYFDDLEVVQFRSLSP